MVFIDVQPSVPVAFEPDCRAGDLAEAVVLPGFHLQPLLQFRTQTGRDRLSHQDQAPQPQQGRSHAGSVKVHRQLSGRGRGGDEHRGPVIPQHHDLLFQGKRGVGNHAGADGLGTLLVVPPPVGETGVQGDLENVHRRDATGLQGARDDLPPDQQVLAGVTADGRLERGPRSGVNADDVPQRHRKQPVGIVLPQVPAIGEADALEVFEALDFGGVAPRGLEAVPVKADVAAGPVEGALQPFQLKLAALLGVHVDHGVHLPSSKSR